MPSRLAGREPDPDLVRDQGEGFMTHLRFEAWPSPALPDQKQASRSSVRRWSCFIIALVLFPFIAAPQMFAFEESIRRGLSPDKPNVSGTVNRVVQGVRIHAVR